MGIMHAHRGAWWVLLLALLAALSLLALSGCNDDSADMAQQIAKGGGPKASGGAGGQAASGGAAQAPGAANAAENNGGEVAGLNTADTPGGPNTGVPSAAEVKAEEPAGPKVTVEVIEIKAPYPEFTGQGRYDVSVSAIADGYLEAAVWHIVAFDEDDKEVGHMEKHLKIPQKIARTFRWNDFFCTKIPVRFEFQHTDKEAVKPEEGAAGGTGGRGTGGAGGSGTGVSGGAGGGGTGGGGSAGNGGGGAGNGGGEEDAGDKGGGDSGGGSDGGDE